MRSEKLNEQIRAGSMPPFSKELWEEGAQMKSFKLVNKGKFDEEGIVKIMSEDPAQYPGCSGTRTLSDVGRSSLLLSSLCPGWKLSFSSTEAMLTSRLESLRPPRPSRSLPPWSRPHQHPRQRTVPPSSPILHESHHAHCRARRTRPVTACQQEIWWEAS